MTCNNLQNSTKLFRTIVRLYSNRVFGINFRDPPIAVTGRLFDPFDLSQVNLDKLAILIHNNTIKIYD